MSKGLTERERMGEGGSRENTTTNVLIWQACSSFARESNELPLLQLHIEAPLCTSTSALELKLYHMNVHSMELNVITNSQRQSIGSQRIEKVKTNESAYTVHTQRGVGQPSYFGQEEVGSNLARFATRSTSAMLLELC